MRNVKRLILLFMLALSLTVFIACDEGQGDLSVLNGAKAISNSVTYTDGVAAKLNVTTPSGIEGVTVSYRTKDSESGTYGEWSATEPVLNAVGKVYAEVKFSKAGYADVVIENLTIEVTEKAFENAAQMVQSDITLNYTGAEQTANVLFTVPDGAAIAYSTDNGKNWTSEITVTNPGETSVKFKVTKANYKTVEGEYKIKVVVPFADKVWYYVYDSQGADAQPSMVYSYANFSSDLSVVVSEMGEGTYGNYTCIYTVKYADNKYTINATDKANGKDYTCYYSEEEGLTAEGYGEMALLSENDSWLTISVIYSGQNLNLFAVAENGKLTEAQINSFSGFGKLYTTATGEDGSLVTAETVLKNNAQLYCLYVQEDYSGKAFIGLYEYNGKLAIEIEAKQLSFDGTVVNYFAAEDDDSWVISALFGEMTYNKTTGEIVYGESEESKSTYTKVDTTVKAIVTVISSNEDLKYYTGKFVVNKGEAFTAVSQKDGNLSKLVFDGYSGAAITENTALNLSDVISVQIGGLFGVKYGNYALSYIFNEEDNAVTISKNGIEEVGEYSVSISENGIADITITLAGGKSFTAQYASGYLTVDEDGYKGLFGSFGSSIYEGAPFVNEFTYTYYNDETTITETITISSDGNIYKDGENIAKNGIEVSVNGGIFIIEFINDLFEDEMTYNSSTRELTYSENVYTAAPVYMGTYIFKGSIIVISNGMIEIDEQSYFGLEGTKSEDIYTITFGDSLSLTYSISADTITYKGNIYNRTSGLLDGMWMPFTSKDFTNNDHTAKIDECGTVFLDGVAAGEITKITAKENNIFIIVYKCFSEESATATYAYDSSLQAETLTIDSAVYVYSQQSSGGEYAGLPFVNVAFVNGEKVILITEDGEILLNKDVIGNLLEVDNQDGFYNFTYLSNDESKKGSYNSKTEELVLDDITYTKA